MCPGLRRINMNTVVDPVYVNGLEMQRVTVRRLELEERKSHSRWLASKRVVFPTLKRRNSMRSRFSWVSSDSEGEWRVISNMWLWDYYILVLVAFWLNNEIRTYIPFGDGALGIVGDERQARSVIPLLPKLSRASKFGCQNLSTRCRMGGYRHTINRGSFSCIWYMFFDIFGEDLEHSRWIFLVRISQF